MDGGYGLDMDIDRHIGVDGHTRRFIVRNWIT